MYQLSNPGHLGKSERDIVMSMRTIAYQLTEQEALAKEIMKKKGCGLKMNMRSMESSNMPCAEFG